MEVMESKSTYTKGDIGEIEPSCLLQVYGGETFFSLMAEEAQIYEVVHGQFKA